MYSIILICTLLYIHTTIYNYINQVLATFPVKAQIANILGFVGHTVSVVTLYSVFAALMWP